MKTLRSDCTARGLRLESHPFHPITRRIQILSCAGLHVCFPSLFPSLCTCSTCASADRQLPLSARLATCGALENSLVERREGDGEKDGSCQRGGEELRPPPASSRRHHLPSRRLPPAASSRLNKLPGAEGRAEGPSHESAPAGHFGGRVKSEPGDDSSADASAAV